MMGVKNEFVGGRYRLIDVVGSGGSGVVWRAHDSELSRDIAIKLLSSELQALQNNKARVWREARLAALLSSSGAVPVYDFGDDGDHCFLVMELINAPTLRKILEIDEFEPLAFPDMLSIGLSLLSVIKNAHKMNVIHRDIKPENIFVFGQLGRELTIQLVDFGLAFLGETSRVSLGRLSDDQSISGTPAYLSPEQARGASIDTPSDIYSTGCVLYEMSSGDVPFTGPIAEVLGKHIYVPPIPLLERIPGISPDLSHLVDQMLSKRASDRPSADQVFVALDSMAKVSQTGMKPSRRSSSPLPRSLRMFAASTKRLQAPSEMIKIGFIGAIPADLTDRIGDSGLVISQAPSQAQVFFARPNLPTSKFPRNRHVVAWLQAEETVDISELIRKGFRDVFSLSTPVEAMVAKLARLLRSPTCGEQGVSR